MAFLLEDLFDVKDIDQDGKKFDNGLKIIFSFVALCFHCFVWLGDSLVLG
jgi:hypothetical protein